MLGDITWRKPPTGDRATYRSYDIDLSSPIRTPAPSRHALSGRWHLIRRGRTRKAERGSPSKAHRATLASTASISLGSLVTFPPRGGCRRRPNLGHGWTGPAQSVHSRRCGRYWPPSEWGHDGASQPRQIWSDPCESRQSALCVDRCGRTEFVGNV